MDRYPLISIIVPVYNSEKFLTECIQSIVSQSYKNWELLLIDDGSNDKSAQICDKFKECFNNIRVWHTNNQGVSSARNLGLKEAKGQWIKFLDSDDFMDAEALKTLIENTQDSDIVCHGYMEFPKEVKHKITNDIKLYPDFQSTYSDVEKLFLHCFYNTICNKLYKRDILKYTFDEKLSLGEDLLFNLANMPLARGIKLIPDILYRYRVLPVQSLSKFSDTNALNVQVYLKKALDNSFDNKNKIRQLTSISFLNAMLGKMQLLVYDKRLSKSDKLKYLSSWLYSKEFEKALVYRQNLSLIRRILLKYKSSILIYYFFRFKKFLSNFKVIFNKF